MLTMKDCREQIREDLRQVELYIRDSVAQDMTDINRYAEDFYCGLLNTAFGYQLRNLNRERRNHPAIDLADDDNQIGVQVTSTTTRDKVRETLKKFFDDGLDDKYKRLILVVIGTEDEFRDPFRVERGFEFDPDRDIWDTPRLLDKLENIGDIDVLGNVAAYLEKHVNRPRKERPARLNLPLRTAMAENSFVGRADELAKIAEQFQTKQIVVLSGLGGMGKTELAVRFAQTYDRGEVSFAAFSRDFFHTVVDEIAQGVEGLLEKLPEEEKFRAVLSVLRKCDREDLLIIDNADTEEASFEGLRRDLSVLPMRILITTRCEARKAIPVAALHRQELHAIFRQYEAPVDETQMNALIDAVDSHTLTVDLMARSMTCGRRAATADKLLDALNKRDLNSESFKKIGANYNDGLNQARINEHLKAVFQVSELSEDEQENLRYATLLPVGGMNDELFMAPFVEEMQDVLDNLIEKGWLEWKDDLLKIHPVIRIVCLEVLKPTEENCDDFLTEMWDQYDPNHYDKDRYRQLAELFTLASTDLEDQEGNYALRAGIIWGDLSGGDPDDTKRALECELQIAAKLESTQKNPSVLANTYYDVGGTYDNLGEYQKALEYKRKALTIREKVLPPDHPDLVTSYNNVGMTYGELGDHQRALEYKLKALAICEKVLPPDHPDLALSYSNVGSTYGNLGDHQRALEYNLKDLAICEKVLPPDHPDFAASYNNVGSTYGDLGDHQKALEYQLKALAIQEKTLPPDHPYNVMCCGNIAVTYAQMDDFTSALAYADKVLKKAERSMQGHPNLEMFRQTTATLKLLAEKQAQGIPFENPFK